MLPEEEAWLLSVQNGGGSTTRKPHRRSGADAAARRARDERPLPSSPPRGATTACNRPYPIACVVHSSSCPGFEYPPQLQT